MNQKIKKLVLSAIRSVENEDEASKLFIGDEFAEKFAELLVQDLVKVLESTMMGSDKMGDHHFDRDVANHTIRTCQAKIKKQYTVD